uniref:Endothelin receptor type Ab n=1 Tax=Sinocyclocheilus anshuiensis TaxID=1608454 RepID=A0A671QB14_9TELE
MRPPKILLMAAVSCVLIGGGNCQSNSSDGFQLSADPSSGHRSLNRVTSDPRAVGSVRVQPLSLPPACLRRTYIEGLFKYVNTVLSCLIFVVGMVGNATLLRIIYLNKTMRNGPNALIASLALGDLIYIAIDIPINVYKVTNQSDHSITIFYCLPVNHKCKYVCVRRYRAVVSWSRVQGVGIPVSTAVEILCIWLLAIVLAVPEAIGFKMVSFDYNSVTIRTCMLKPETPFMTVTTRHKMQLFDVYCNFATFIFMDFHLFVVLFLCLSFLLVFDYLSINLATINSCINPIILYFVSKKFKNCFRSCLCCWCYPAGSLLSSVVPLNGTSFQYKSPDQNGLSDRTALRKDSYN